MAKAKLGIGVIGPGGISQSVHIPGFQLCPDVAVVAIAGRRAEQTAAVGDRFGIPYRSTDWREVVRHPEVDAVVIATPPHLHHEISVAAAQAGKHVMGDVGSRRTFAFPDAGGLAASRWSVRAKGRGVLHPAPPALAGSPWHPSPGRNIRTVEQPTVFTAVRPTERFSFLPRHCLAKVVSVS